jgi:hypothetical protein
MNKACKPSSFIFVFYRNSEMSKPLLPCSQGYFFAFDELLKLIVFGAFLRHLPPFSLFLRVGVCFLFMLSFSSPCNSGSFKLILYYTAKLHKQLNTNSGGDSSSVENSKKNACAAPSLLARIYFLPLTNYLSSLHVQSSSRGHKISVF